MAAEIAKGIEAHRHAQQPAMSVVGPGGEGVRVVKKQAARYKRNMMDVVSRCSKVWSDAAHAGAFGQWAGEDTKWRRALEVSKVTVPRHRLDVLRRGQSGRTLGRRPERKDQ